MRTGLSKAWRARSVDDVRGRHDRHDPITDPRQVLRSRDLPDSIWHLEHLSRQATRYADACIQVSAGEGIDLHEDTATLGAEPTWELNVVSASMTTAALKTNAVFSVAQGYNEAQGGFVTNFYYGSHEATDENRIEVLGLEGSRLRVRLTGETVDVNFYDGSKPPTKLLAELVLEHDPDTVRSMS